MHLENFYKKISPIYNFLYSDLLFREARKAAIELLDIQKNSKILEIGVGTGLTLPLYPKDCEVTGIDLSEGMLKKTEALIRRNSLTNCKAFKMDATTLHFEDKTFDCVLGNLFISATSQPELAIAEIKRVCKSNGIFVFMNHFRSHNTFVQAFEDRIDPWTKKLTGFKASLDLDHLVEKNHLVIENRKSVNPFGLWTAVSFRNSK